MTDLVKQLEDKKKGVTLMQKIIEAEKTKKVKEKVGKREIICNNCGKKHYIERPKLEYGHIIKFCNGKDGCRQWFSPDWDGETCMRCNKVKTEFMKHLAFNSDGFEYNKFGKKLRHWLCSNCSKKTLSEGLESMHGI